MNDESAKAPRWRDQVLQGRPPGDIGDDFDARWVRGLTWLLSPTAQDEHRPSASWLEDLNDDRKTHAASDLALESVARADFEGLEAWAALLDGSGAEALASHVRRWAAFFRGDPQSQAGARGQVPESVRIESMILDAFAADARGDLSEAVRAARHALRVARSDEFVFHEYLAAITLARLRRRTGHAHLARLILRELEQVLPSCLKGWVRWELWMTGEPVPTLQTLEEEIAKAGGSRFGALDVPRIHAAIAGVEATTVFDADILALQREWAPATAPAAVVFRRGERPRLQLRCAVPTDVPLIERRRRSDARSATLLFEVARAGERGVDVAELFATVYGFRYHATKHGAALRTSLHRARKLLGSRGQLQRDEQTLRLEVAAGIVIADPRSEANIRSRVLSALGDGHSSTQGLADALGLSLRAVQSAVQQLLEEGCCRRGETGKYAIEDTTFRAPTESRVRARTLIQRHG